MVYVGTFQLVCAGPGTGCLELFYVGLLAGSCCLVWSLLEGGLLLSKQNIIYPYLFLPSAKVELGF